MVQRGHSDSRTISWGTLAVMIPHLDLSYLHLVVTRDGMPVLQLVANLGECSKT
jgi:hypothetical protein